MNLQLKRTPGVYLVGFMASGKSTVGRRLACRLGWNFFDTDEEIVNAEQCSIAELFAQRGEAEFRRIETLVLSRHVAWIKRGRPAVLALGGGAFTLPENRQLIAGNGISVWLDCSLDRARNRLQRSVGPVRPLAQDPETFASLYAMRREHYSLADVRIPVDTDDADRTVDAILASPFFQ
jgi:shikimate kinase